MRNVLRRTSRCKHYPHPDLFAWAADRDRRHRAPYHVRHVAARHNITEAMAAVICVNAGIGGTDL